MTWDFDSGDADGVSVRIFQRGSNTLILTLLDQAAQSETAYQELAQSRPNNVLTLNHETHCTYFTYPNRAPTDVSITLAQFQPCKSNEKKKPFGINY